MSFYSIKQFAMKPVVFLPQPKWISFGSDKFILPARLVITISTGELYPVARMIGGLFKNSSVHADISGRSTACRVLLRDDLKPDGYRLRISSKGILLEAKSVAAAFWGFQTLRQVAEQSPKGALPGLKIDDWPDFADRGILIDLARGRVPRLEYLMQMVECLAQYKLNQFQLYIEHTFAFRGHPLIGKNASPLSADDILKLDEHCRRLHVELVPCLASFGHMSSVLKHKPYHHLAEDWGVGKYVDSNARLPHKGWTLSPANPAIYKFLDELFAEFLPLFSSRRFNVCCDETWDLGLGQSYKLCQKLGKGVVYLNHIIKLRELAGKYGKKIMFWGDIIRHYPDLIKRIPKDVMVLDWAYQHDHKFSTIADFKKSGLPFYACPSTSSYVALFPRQPVAMDNIAGFAAAAFKEGAQGVLNTEWGDGGHYNFPECSWHGFLFGAEQSWNTKAGRNDFTRRFCRLFLNTSDQLLARALDDLGAVSMLASSAHYQSIWRYMFFAPYGGDLVLWLGKDKALQYRAGKIVRDKIIFDAALGQATLKKLDAIRRVFIAYAGQRGIDPRGVLPYWIFAVDTLRHAARKLAALGIGGTDTAVVRRKLATEMIQLRQRFKRLWLAHSYISEIGQTLKLYRQAIRSLKRPAMVCAPPVNRLMVSRAMPSAGKLEGLKYPSDIKALRFRLHDFWGSYCNFRDLFAATPGKNAMVWISRELICKEPMRFVVILGHEGSAKLWMDGKLRYYKPVGVGISIIRMPFVTEGRHVLLLALNLVNGNSGSLWLQFGRRDRPRGSATLLPQAQV